MTGGPSSGATDGATWSTVRSLMADALALPRPGCGATAERHRQLAEVARTHDVSVARLYEENKDALAILAEADREAPVDTLYGVWASEGGPSPLRYDPGRERLEGTKPFCSGLGLVDRALVTARIDRDTSSWSAPNGPRASVLVDTSVRRADTIAMSSAGWRSNALVDTATGTVDFDDHPGKLVGPPGWYLERPGFWHGACGPAACWAGGAIGLVDEARVRIDDDPHRLAHVGAMVATTWSLHALLVQAGHEIDREPTDTMAGERRARALRWTVERSVIDVIDRFGRGFGPRPQTESTAVAHRIADLQLYVRQHHAERELAVLGRLAPATGTS